MNKAEALGCAAAGAARARRAPDAEPRATIAPTTWHGIVDVADELDAALIVIGSRGPSGLREIARRNVSHHVATQALVSGAVREAWDAGPRASAPAH